MSDIMQHKVTRLENCLPFSRHKSQTYYVVTNHLGDFWGPAMSADRIRVAGHAWEVHTPDRARRWGVMYSPQQVMTEWLKENPLEANIAEGRTARVVRVTEVKTFQIDEVTP